MRTSAAICLCVVLLWGSEAPGVNVKTYEDNLIAEVDSVQLLCDITVPDSDSAPPLIVWIHGGGWRKGSCKHVRIPWVTECGFALASISYRFTDKAVFPSQIHDCKGAIRWLRANADRFGYDASRIAVSGSSAGAHLAMLLGTSSGVPELEGDIGGNLGQSSAVQAVVQYFGPSDFILRAETQPETVDTQERGSFQLLNGAATGRIDMHLARQASPVTYVSSDSPPLLSFQGLADDVVLPDQAERITEAYREHGAISELVLVDGAGHGGGVASMFEGGHRERMIAFLRARL